MMFLSHFVLISLEILFVLNHKLLSKLNVFVTFIHSDIKMVESINFCFKLTFLAFHFVIQRFYFFLQRNLISVNAACEFIYLFLDLRGVLC
jgi:hypothetical protein